MSIPSTPDPDDPADADFASEHDDTTVDPRDDVPADVDDENGPR